MRGVFDLVRLVDEPRDDIAVRASDICGGGGRPCECATAIPIAVASASRVAGFEGSLLVLSFCELPLLFDEAYDLEKLGGRVGFRGVGAATWSCVVSALSVRGLEGKAGEVASGRAFFRRRLGEADMRSELCTRESEAEDSCAWRLEADLPACSTSP